VAERPDGVVDVVVVVCNRFVVMKLKMRRIAERYLRLSTGRINSRGAAQCDQLLSCHYHFGLTYLFTASIEYTAR